MSRQQILDFLLKRQQLVVGVVLVVVVVVVVITLGDPRRAATELGAIPAGRIAGEGTLSGAVEGCGGTSPRRCSVTNVSFCAPVCLTTRYVVAKIVGGQIVAKARLQQGRFSVAIPPGAYTLELLATGKGGVNSVFQTRHATVRRHATSAVTFKLSLR